MRALELFGATMLVVVASVAWQTQAPGDAAPPAPSNACPAGLTPREAAPGDRLCVGWQSHDRIRFENRLAAQRTEVDASSGVARCREPYVPRGAVPGDDVCVTLASRKWVRIENAGAAARP